VPFRHRAVELFGSLDATGRGYGTGHAVVAGPTGYEPHSVDPAVVSEKYNETSLAALNVGAC
jgi:hypothetical protein